MVTVSVNERPLVIPLKLFDLGELSHGLLLQSERGTALSRCACGLIFIHVLKREMGIAILEITWLIQKRTSGKAGFMCTRETTFLKCKAFWEAVGLPVGVGWWDFFSRWRV